MTRSSTALRRRRSSRERRRSNRRHGVPAARSALPAAVVVPAASRSPSVAATMGAAAGTQLAPQRRGKAAFLSACSPVVLTRSPESTLWLQAAGGQRRDGSKDREELLHLPRAERGLGRATRVTNLCTCDKRHPLKELHSPPMTAPSLFVIGFGQLGSALARGLADRS